MELSRRGMFGGLLAALAMPAIIRTPALLMPIKPRIMIKPGWNVGSQHTISPATLNDQLRLFYGQLSVEESIAQRHRTAQALYSNARNGIGDMTVEAFSIMFDEGNYV